MLLSPAHWKKDVEPLPTKPPEEYQCPGHRRETTLTLAGWQRIIRENFRDHWQPSEIATAYGITQVKEVAQWEGVFEAWKKKLEGWNDTDLRRSFNVYVESKEKFAHPTGKFVPPQPAHLIECLTELNLRRTRRVEEALPKASHKGRLQVKT
jgi:hypothetical protein